MGYRQARKIQSWITRFIDLWERGHHSGLVGYAEAEGDAQEGRDTSGSEEEDEAVARSYHGTLFLGKLQQAVYRATDRERGY